MKNLLNRIRLNYKYIGKQATKFTAGIFSTLGLISMFVTLSDLLDDNISIYVRIAVSVGILFAIFLISFFGCAVYYAFFKRRIVISELNGGHHIYVQYGDIFSEDEVICKEQRRNIVIPVNRCFDTVVDDDLISSNTVHGAAMKRLYEMGLFTEESLCVAIQEDLKRQCVQPEEVLSVTDKRKGNLKRYPAGTVAEVHVSDRCTYFFLGLSKFDFNLKASTSDDEYVLSLMRLLEFCDRRSQQFPIVMPLIGGGLSRVDKSEHSILQYIAKLIKLNEPLMHSDIHIVVRDSGKETIAITDI